MARKAVRFFAVRIVGTIATFLFYFHVHFVACWSKCFLRKDAIAFQKRDVKVVSMGSLFQYGHVDA